MRNQPERTVTGDQNVALLQPGGEFFSFVRNEENHVRLACLRKEFDFVDICKAVYQPLGLLMIFCQSRDVILQSMNAACSDDASLAHAAAGYFAPAKGTRD